MQPRDETGNIRVAFGWMNKLLLLKLKNNDGLGNDVRYREHMLTDGRRVDRGRWIGTDREPDGWREG